MHSVQFLVNSIISALRIMIVRGRRGRFFDTFLIESFRPADAGILSASNPTALDEAGPTFIVGSPVAKAPGTGVPVPLVWKIIHGS